VRSLPSLCEHSGDCNPVQRQATRRTARSTQLQRRAQDWHPVIRLDEDGEREILNMRWGFLSKEAKTEKSVKTPINARAESILTTWPFREAIRYRRCMVPVNGFYEWVRPESRPDDCPARSCDRTCRPIGSTLGGQAGW
jgi:putative SOS response-associated peptidase YedK